MKTIKLTLVFFLLSFVFTTIFAQEEKPKTKVEKPNSTQAITDKIEFKNETGNSIMKITDEGNNAGSIYLSDGIALTGFNNDYKLYSVSGILHWNGFPLAATNAAAGWTLFSGNIYNTTLSSKVGIGTDNPQSKLSVGGLGNPSAAISSETTTGWGVYGMATTGRGVFGSANGTNGEGIIAEAHGQNGRAISGYASDASGYAGYFNGRGFFSENVGIGTVSPAYKLHVKATEDLQPILVVENTSTNLNADGIEIDIDFSNPGVYNQYLRFRKAGDVIIGSVSGNSMGGVAYNTTSDARLKTMIKEYSNALETVSQIGIKKYERIANPGIREIGVLAQELQKVYPQAVSGSPDSDVKTDPMMVDYSKLTPLLVKGMQEQQKLIEELQTEVQELKREISGKRFTSK